MVDKKKLIERVKLKLAKTDYYLKKCKDILKTCKKKGKVELCKSFWVCSKKYMESEKTKEDKKDLLKDILGELPSKIDFSKHQFWAIESHFEDKPTAMDNEKDLLDFIKKNKLEFYVFGYPDDGDDGYPELPDLEGLLDGVDLKGV